VQRAVEAAIVVGALAIVPAPAASAAARPYDAHSVIVRYAASATPGAKARAAHAAGVVARVARVAGAGAHVVRVKGDPRAAARRLNRSRAVLYAEPNHTMRIMNGPYGRPGGEAAAAGGMAYATPNDPRFDELYGLARLQASVGWDLAGLGAFPAAGGVEVGIVDTGIDASHEDLIGKVDDCGTANSSGTPQAGGCADDNDHGTHVAGTVAAIANNGRGVAGVAFNSRLSICKALNGALGTGTAAGVSNCITWLHERGAKVISMSLGGPASTTLRNAVTGAWQNGEASGSVVVAAAGNDGNATVNYPAGYPDVVSVAATDRNDARAYFSNANADVEVSAPGAEVLSTLNGGGYAAFSGTSMATPHVAGAAALIWGRNPDFTAAQVRAKLDGSVDDLGAAGRDNAFGFGRLNLVKALAP
jgi:thermitase